MADFYHVFIYIVAFNTFTILIKHFRKTIFLVNVALNLSPEFPGGELVIVIFFLC